MEKKQNKNTLAAARRQTAQAAQYMKVVTWSEEDRCFIGRCPELFAGGVHGNDELKVYRELCQAAEEWVAILEKDGKPLPKPDRAHGFSGKFLLRMSPRVHEALAVKAALRQQSLNAYAVMALAAAAGVDPMFGDAAAPVASLMAVGESPGGYGGLRKRLKFKD